MRAELGGRHHSWRWASGQAKSRKTVAAARLMLTILAGLAGAAEFGCGISGGGTHHASTTTTTAAPAEIVVTPSQASVPEGASLSMKANVTGTVANAVMWKVNGVLGGNSVVGAISPEGVYVAPTISPGGAVTVIAVSTVDSTLFGSATVKVVTPNVTLQGATYADTVRSWSALTLPWIDSLVGLVWDPAARTWSPDPLWQMPVEGVGPNVYFLEEALRPATRLALSRHDVPLMEQLALFHLALLEQRTTTLGTMKSSAQAGDYVFLDGPANTRTFAWYESLAGGKREIRESQLSNTQYLSTAAQLLRAIAEVPSGNRTAPLIQFATVYGRFLVSEQLLRLLYGATWWAHWQDSAIGNPVVAAWIFLGAHPGYQPLPPNPQYYAAISDAELWLMMDAAEVVAANADAPELGLMDTGTQQQLRNAVQAGSAVMRSRCQHKTSADGADVLSAFAGEWQDLPDFTYSAVTTQQAPTHPDVQPGLSWDTSHAYRLPIVFRSLYETGWASGATYPARSDLIALGNTYVHLTQSKAVGFPAFNNYLDGTDGWLMFDPAQPAAGYPPHAYCNARDKGNCVSVGAVQGWGELSLYNPEVAALEQKIVSLAYDNSQDGTAFKNQYYYADGPYAVSQGVYPWLMMWVAADNAEQLSGPYAVPGP